MQGMNIVRIEKHLKIYHCSAGGLQHNASLGTRHSHCKSQGSNKQPTPDLTEPPGN